MATESSVVAALREVRRLEDDRQKRQKARQEEEARAWEDARVRASQSMPAQNHQDYYDGYASGGYQNGNHNGNYDGYQDGYGGGQGYASQGAYAHGQSSGVPTDQYAHMRRTAELSPLEAQGWRGSHAAQATNGAWGHSASGGYAAQAAYAGSVESAKRRSSAGPVFFTLLLCAAGAGAGYYKLDQEFRATMAAKDGIVTRLERERNDAFEARAKAENEARVKIANVEQRIKELEKTAASKGVAIPATATPAATPTPAPSDAAKAKPAAPVASKASRERAKSSSSKRVLAAVSKPEPVKKAAPLPPEIEKPEKPKIDKETAAAVRRVTTAKKKNDVNSDDPIGGLRF